MSALTKVALREGRPAPPADAWYAGHPNGYRAVGAAFAILDAPLSIDPYDEAPTPHKRAKRRYRALPAGFHERVGRRASADPLNAAPIVGNRPLVSGRVPIVPTTILCPLCGRHNLITVPS